MGRKIPAKKHHGVKDPLVQQARRMQLLKSKINAPPKDPDDQPMPKSLIRLFGLENKDADKKKKNLKKIKKNTESINKSKNPVSGLRKLPGESGRSFSLRINSAVRALHTDDLADDYPQDMEEEDEKGQRMAAHRERREKKRRRAAQGRPAAAPAPAPAKSMSKSARRAAARLARQQPARSPSPQLQYERVAFGDVAHAPPTLRGDSAPRPGRRQLLLTPLLKPASSPPTGAASKANQLRLERARLDAVEAYRALKNAKRKHVPG